MGSSRHGGNFRDRRGETLNLEGMKPKRFALRGWEDNKMKGRNHVLDCENFAKTE